MLQLLSPAGSTEAVIAAVQSGTDMVYMGYGMTGTTDADADRGTSGFTSRELTESLRYCRVRGCPAAVAINELTTDAAIATAAERAVYAAEQGASALIIQDLGLLSVLRESLPDIPLWAGVRMNIHNPGGAAAVAALGVSRIMLPPELTLDEIRAIASSVSVELAVCVHGPLCFAHVGQCYLSAMRDPDRSDSCMRCTEPCRERFSLGGHMDDYPMSLADTFLLGHLDELREAGISAVYIEGRGRAPEYVAAMTRLYSNSIRDRIEPTAEEMSRLRGLFASNGLTDGYFTGEQGADMFGTPQKPDRAAQKALAEIRRGIMSGEMRRVPVKFYAVIQRDKPALFAAEDAAGHRAVHKGYVPADLGRLGISAERVREIFFRTGGTPYSCSQMQCAIDPDLDYPDEALDQARRSLLAQITEQNRQPASVRTAPLPRRPESVREHELPQLIIQISRPEQATEELAAAQPHLLYVPAELLAAGKVNTAPFEAAGARVAAVLPQCCSHNEMADIRELLATLRERGIRQVLLGNLGYIPAVREAGLLCRGDMGLNITNSWAAGYLARGGFASLTASFQLSADDIRRMAKPVDTEMIIYGRVPVMVTERCLIRASAGRCACQTPARMSDGYGRVYPVARDFGCRNIVYDDKKIFLADRPELYTGAGLWAGRLLFTTESPRECVQVATRYRGRSNYLPNNISFGLYLKGAVR